MLKVTVDPTGAALEVAPGATVLPDALVSCVVAEIKRGHLAQPRAGSGYLIPLSFVPFGMRGEPRCSSPVSPAAATNTARAAFQHALKQQDAGEQKREVLEAIAHYRNARDGWLFRLATKPDEEYRFRYADAAYWIVVLQVALDQSPTPREIAEAEIGARSGQGQQPEASGSCRPRPRHDGRPLVGGDFKRFKETNGAEGLEPHATPDLDTSPLPPAVPLPPEAQSTIELRTDFLRVSSPGGAFYDERPLFALGGAQRLVAYGQADAAETWLETAQHEGCVQHSPIATKAHRMRVALARASGKKDEAGKIENAPDCSTDQSAR